MQNGRIKKGLVQTFQMHLGMLIWHWFSALHIFTSSSQIHNFCEVLRLENAVESFQFERYHLSCVSGSISKWFYDFLNMLLRPTIVKSIYDFWSAPKWFFKQLFWKLMGLNEPTLDAAVSTIQCVYTKEIKNNCLMLWNCILTKMCLTQVWKLTFVNI